MGRESGLTSSREKASIYLRADPRPQRELYNKEGRHSLLNFEILLLQLTGREG